MSIHIPTLLFAAAVAALLAAAVMSLTGYERRVYRGYGHWLCAQWLLVLGLALILGAPAATWAPILAGLLLLQWPVVVLLGMRRFHARQPMRCDARVDAFVLLAAAVAVVLAESVLTGSGKAAVMHVAWGGLHLYVAALFTSSDALKQGHGLRVLAGAMGAAGTLVALMGLMLGTGIGMGTGTGLAPGPGTPDGAGQAGWTGAVLVHDIGLAAALLALTMTYMAMTITNERNERELRDSRRRLRYLANIDMLTQVPNRRHFGELARIALQRQEHRSAAVLMFDIDHFKNINDMLGHAAGDRALRTVSRCVQGTLRSQDVTGRHGGDEFVLLLPDTSMRDAMAVATRIVAKAQEEAQQQAVPLLSLSFGVVQMRTDESLDEAMRRADQALYEAKRQGRGRAVSADGDERSPVFVESRRLGLTES
jgi:diguanylate cyclase (GGDEF)-like protein